MSWKVRSVKSQREEFVVLASGEAVVMSELCQRFGISRKTGYKWLARYREAGAGGLADRSRRPKSPAGQTDDEMEARVLSLRKAHPAWGGRKLRRRLEDTGVKGVPSASTITSILRRHEALDPAAGAGEPRAFQRFEHPAANDLWQMDFKGHFPLTRGGRCHPLTVLDDHSRYSLGLRACVDERGETVQEELKRLFRRYGLPRRMLMDNGSPWGDEGGQPWTRLTVWLLRLGVSVSHGRPFHPQTQGKEERFHRTLKAEVLRDRSFVDVVETQVAFDVWQRTYNQERPHEALGMAVPSSRYRPSARSYPETLPVVEYGEGVVVRKVHGDGLIRYLGNVIRVGKSFAGEPVGLVRLVGERSYAVQYGHAEVGRLCLPETRGSATVKLVRTRGVVPE